MFDWLPATPRQVRFLALLNLLYGVNHVIIFGFSHFYRRVCATVFAQGDWEVLLQFQEDLAGSDSKVSSEERKLEFHWRAIFRELE